MAADPSRADSGSLEAEVDALLAKIPDKYKSSAPVAQRKPRRSLWSCEPITAVATAAFAVCVVVLISMSMASKPFWTFAELSGVWSVEALGDESHDFLRQGGKRLRDDRIQIACERPGGVDDTFLTAADEADKLVGDLPEATCRFDLGSVAFRRSVLMAPARAVGGLWTWAGRCNDVASGSELFCTLATHRKRLLISVFDHDAVVRSFVLHRAVTKDEDFWSTLRGLWYDKGRFLVVLLVVVVVLKGFLRALTPKSEMSRRLLQKQERARRALLRKELPN